MRHSLTGWLIAAIVLLVPIAALAGNQETADEIAKTLQQSGQLNGYNVEVSVQDGTAWLTGTVRDRKQANSALKLAFGTEGVNRVVNGLKTGPAAARRKAAPKQENPIRLASGAGMQRPATVTNAYALSGSSKSAARPASGRASRRSKSQMPATTQVKAAAALLETMPAMPQQPVAGQPMPVAYARPMARTGGGPLPSYVQGVGGVAPARYDQPNLPNYSWPSYAAHPNYAALTYPTQYSPTAWPYIGPFYPYPQVPMGWRKVTLEWSDGWWMLDFKD